MTYEFHVEGQKRRPFVAVNIQHPVRGEIVTVVDQDGTITDYVVSLVKRKLWDPRTITRETENGPFLEDQITEVMLVETKDIADGHRPNPIR